VARPDSSILVESRIFLESKSKGLSRVRGQSTFVDEVTSNGGFWKLKEKSKFHLFNLIFNLNYIAYSAFVFKDRNFQYFTIDFLLNQVNFRNLYLIFNQSTHFSILQFIILHCNQSYLLHRNLLQPC